MDQSRERGSALPYTFGVVAIEKGAFGLSSIKVANLKGANAPSENSNISDFNEIKIILLMFTGSQGLYLGVYTNLVIGNWVKCWISYFNS